MSVAALRLLIAALVLLAIQLYARERAPIERSHRRTLAFAGIALALHFATWIWSLEYTSVALSILLVSTTPLWTAFGDWLIFRRALAVQTVVAFATGAIGLALVVANNAATPPQPGHALVGCALALIGAIAFATYLLLVRDVRANVPLRTIVTHTYSWAACALTIAAFIARQGPPSLSNVPAWSGILAMALVSQLLGHTAINASLRWFSANAVAFSTLLEPAIAMVLAFAFFGEPLTLPALLGAIVVLASLAVVLGQERTAPA